MHPRPLRASRIWSPGRAICAVPPRWCRPASTPAAASSPAIPMGRKLASSCAVTRSTFTSKTASPARRSIRPISTTRNIALEGHILLPAAARCLAVAAGDVRRRQADGRRHGRARPCPRTSTSVFVWEQARPGLAGMGGRQHVQDARLPAGSRGRRSGLLLSYTQRLPVVYGAVGYRFPAGHSFAEVGEWSLHVRVKGGAGLGWQCESHKLAAAKDGDDLLLTDGAAERPAGPRCRAATQRTGRQGRRCAIRARRTGRTEVSDGPLSSRPGRCSTTGASRLGGARGNLRRPRPAAGTNADRAGAFAARRTPDARYLHRRHRWHADEETSAEAGPQRVGCHRRGNGGSGEGASGRCFRSWQRARTSAPNCWRRARRRICCTSAAASPRWARRRRTN